MPMTLLAIAEEVITELSQVPGVSTQIYSADRIKLMVQNAFFDLFEKRWWDEYTDTFTVALDGITGRITSDLEDAAGAVTEWRDIQLVWPENFNKPLTLAPKLMNPSTISGTYPVYVRSDATVAKRPLRVLPANATGNIVVLGRRRPAKPLSDSYSILLDDMMMKWAACWQYAVDDGTNQAQIAKYEKQMIEREQLVTASYNTHPIALDSYTNTGELYQWTENP